MRPATREVLPRELVLGHCRRPLLFRQIFEAVLADWGRVTERTVHRALAEIVNGGDLVRIQPEKMPGPVYVPRGWRHGLAAEDEAVNAGRYAIHLGRGRGAR